MTSIDFRHQARVLALQALYEIDCTDHPAGQVLAVRLDSDECLPETKVIVTRLVNGVLAQKRQLDELIHHYAPEWPLDQLALIDRNVLRLAVYELTAESSAPVRVIINEAVELAKSFGTESASRFVNGVLGSLVAQQSASRPTRDQPAASPTSDQDIDHT